MKNDFNSIYNLFKHTTTKHPKKTAIFTEQGKINYGQLLEYTNKIAAYLQQNIKRGDNIGLFMDNSWQYIVATYAISAVGATFVPINNTLKSKELSYILSDADIKCIFCSDRLRDVATKSIAIHQCDTVIWVGNEQNKKDFASILEKDISFTPKNVQLEDNAVIFYTSGTTGVSKGTILSNKNILSTYKAMTTHTKMRISDRVALYLPMHLPFSLLPLAIIPICHGASIVLIRYKSALDLLKNLALKRVTILFAAPVIHAKLTQVPNNLLIDLFNRVRLIASGSSTLNSIIAKKIQNKFKKAQFVEAYGLSEGSILVTASPLEKVKIGSVGLPLLDYKVKAVDSYGLELSTNTIGEIIIKGDCVMKGYLNSTIDNPCSIKNGWLYTGDLGYLDDDGYLYISGRKKDLIIYNSMHIYPSQIEPLIDSFEGIKESALVAKKDKICNEVPVAFIVEEENKHINIDNLNQHLKGFLASHKIPTEYIVIKELPRNASGKVLKKVLREQLDNSSS